MQKARVTSSSNASSDEIQFIASRPNTSSRASAAYMKSAASAVDDDLAKLRAEVIRKKGKKVHGLGKLRRARDESAASSAGPSGGNKMGGAAPSTNTK